jgi:hypothetical protein
MPAHEQHYAIPSTIPRTPPAKAAANVVPSLLSPGGGAAPSALDRIEPEVGGVVLTPFGLARVLQVRSRGVVKCQLKASGDAKAPKNKAAALCILNESSYQVLSQAPAGDLTPLQLSQYALRLQAVAVDEARKLHAGRALQLYERVLAASSQLLQLRSALPQSQRGDWVIRTVKCSIAAAQLAIQLGLAPAALDFTKDALGVLDALERNRSPSAGDGTPGSRNPPELPLPPPPSLSSAARKGAAVEREEDTSTASGDSSVTSSSSSTTSGPVLDVGYVKLFGECRIKALLVTAQALLEMEQGKTLAFAALRVLEQAQALLRKYSTKPYLANPDYKSTMKVFVSLQKDLKRLKKRAKLVIKPKVAAPAAQVTSPGRFASWLRSRRVMFADDPRPKATAESAVPAASQPPSPSAVVAAASKVMAAVASSSHSSSSTWTRRDSLVLGGVVAGGLVAFHCVMRRQRI